MKKKQEAKFCPFCYSNPYRYKTKQGLLRHITSYHLFDAKFRPVIDISSVKYLAIELEDQMHFEEISGIEEVEDFLQDYFRGFKNPSKRSSRFFQYVRDSK